MKDKGIAQPTACCITLGCKVSQYESEAIAEALEHRGFRLVSEARGCDAVVINTCTVTAESDRKCRQAIHRAHRENPGAFLAVTGCYAQVCPSQLTEMDYISYLCGSRNKLSAADAAADFVLNAIEPKQRVNVHPLDAMGFEPMRICRSERTRAYVKIEDGCENRCTYCTIPNVRGRVCSKDPQAVVEEVTALAEAGYREVVLTGIEAASYGRDIGGVSLVDLCEAVDGISGIDRIRLGSLDPSYMTPPVIARFAKLNNLTPHFHLSLQSGSDSVLRAMKRRYTAQMAEQTLAALRAAIPGCMFTTDMLFGFPGESEAAFAESLGFIDRAHFLMIHIFPYSRRPGTVADALPGHLPKAVKDARCAEALSHMRTARTEILRQTVGSTYPVLFESYENGIAAGHTPSFIPVETETATPLHNEILPVQIDSYRSDGRCFGRIVN